MNCSVDGDCQPLLVLAGWCASHAQCWAETGACILWPRCNATPYLGCVPSAQECANVHIEEPKAPITGLEVGLFFLLLIGLGMSLFGFALSFYVCWRKEQRPDDHAHWQRIIPESAALGATLDVSAAANAATPPMAREDETMDPFVF